MSSFTQFDSKLYISFSPEATRILKEDHWLLEKGFTYYVGTYGSPEFVSVPAGFLSDGASVPWFGRIFVPRMGAHAQASFLHDYLCETYEISVIEDGYISNRAIDRKTVDYIYFEALDVCGVSCWRRFFIGLGVNLHRWIKRPNKPKPYLKKRALEQRLREELLEINCKIED